MIFNVPGHIEMIRNGLHPRGTFYLAGGFIVKTESRRIERGVYQIEAKRKKPHYKGYAVQRKRGVAAEPDIRIIFEKIWQERVERFLVDAKGKSYPEEILISKDSAFAEGGYTPEQYEKVFRELNPKWDGWSRWTFKFHVIEVRT